MMLSNRPYKNNRYRVINGVHFDTDLQDVNPEMSDLLRDHAIQYVSVTEPKGIQDRSWEMSVALTAARKKSTFATGVLASYKYKRMKFGPITGLDSKVKEYKGMRLEHV